MMETLLFHTFIFFETLTVSVIAPSHFNESVKSIIQNARLVDICFNNIHHNYTHLENWVKNKMQKY